MESQSVISSADPSENTLTETKVIFSKLGDVYALETIPASAEELVAE